MMVCMSVAENARQACDAQRERSGCQIVWCFRDGYNVVPSLRPIDIPHGHPVLLPHLLECFCPLGRVLRVANSLIREAREGDVGWHGCPPSMARAKVCYPHS